MPHSRPPKAPDKVRLGRRSKAKGKLLEKRVAERISDWIGLPTSDIVRARSGVDEADIGLSLEATKRFPYTVECKNHKTLAIPAWLRQMDEYAARARKRGESPGPGVLVFKQHGAGKLYAVIDFELFLELATEHLVKEP